ncbi:MAG: methionyl-tRNA formyltransferase [Flavobacteriales bacterium]
MHTLRIVFMGTPEFAVASLDALVGSNHEVVGVVTVADKPAGRGKQLQMSAVKEYALKHQLPVLQPLKLRDESFLTALKKLEADLFVVVAFRMLPEAVWQMPPQGTINLHGSLLPQFRGAAPINHAIIQGEKETGVTTFFLQHEIDTGNIIDQRRIPIREDETAGELHDEMMHIGAQLLVETVNNIAEGKTTSFPQEGVLRGMDEVKHAPKIFKEDCKIDWTLPLDRIYNLVRGLSPYPAAFTMLEGKTLKIFGGEKIHGATLVLPGAFETDGKTYLKMAAGDGWYSITELQLEGKKKMTTVEFLRGWRPNAS